ncbi:MAG TPA: hypothetical protein VJ971_21375 [Methylomirabilota bacterium]|jgi:hypothetical protein|nr:hypothetical protein [Methylomirabilota bacterium]
MSLIPRVIVRRWLETLLAVFSLAVIYVDRHRELMPRALDLTSDVNLTLWDWLFRGMVFGMMGILSFSALVVAFFLVYSPIYLVNKVPHLVGKGGWLDKREVRFYLACFALICLLVTLLTWSTEAFTILLVLLAGFGPLVWRLLV